MGCDLHTRFPIPDSLDRNLLPPVTTTTKFLENTVTMITCNISSKFLLLAATCHAAAALRRMKCDRTYPDGRVASFEFESTAMDDTPSDYAILGDTPSVVYGVAIHFRKEFERKFGENFMDCVSSCA